MKNLTKVIRGVVTASMVFPALATPLVAQQEVSPDHFDSAAVANANSMTAGANARKAKSAVYRNAKKHAHRVQRAGSQTGSLKKVAG